MDTDDILKLLLIALFLLPGLFGRKKKKEEPDQPYDTEHYEYEDPFKDFKNFENDDSYQENTFEPAPIPNPILSQSVDVIPQEEGSSVFTKEQIEAALALIAQQEAGNDEISKNEIKGEDDSRTISDNEFLINFDLRQALIYSEIICPKYLG
ncbi:MAG: hypothetical protein LBP63_07035 [Prevotellaceae bacterium]|jgi:hypothetical protein|nr:hypothetical protein [Prevotellaceae bacterium]